MKYVLYGLAAFVSVWLLGAAIWGIDYGWRWATAGPVGQLEAREEILSGATRITAYNHFFDLCASVQANEAALAASIDELSATTRPEDQERIRTNITGLTAQRARAIAQYNADARKSYTIGQFRSLSLPYELPPSTFKKGELTSCAA